MSGIHIEPCPFCGEPDDIDSDDWYASGDPSTRTYFVSCGNCGCQGPCDAFQEYAIEFWNRRVCRLTELERKQEGK